MQKGPDGLIRKAPDLPAGQTGNVQLLCPSAEIKPPSDGRALSGVWRAGQGITPLLSLNQRFDEMRAREDEMARMEEEEWDEEG